jgi:hypothetical protein
MDVELLVSGRWVTIHPPKDPKEVSYGENSVDGPGRRDHRVGGMAEATFSST